jgi:hypothetical protein
MVDHGTSIVSHVYLVYFSYNAHFHALGTRIVHAVVAQELDIGLLCKIEKTTPFFSPAPAEWRKKGLTFGESLFGT